MATLLVRQLDIFLDDEDMIGCQGRIEHSSLPKAAKQPILLSTRHHFTELVVNDCHHTVHHNGVKETLNCIHKLYWILHGREAVKHALGMCVICQRYDGKSYATAKIATLPLSQVSDYPPFANMGMDFAGPTICKDWDRKWQGTKRWKKLMRVLSCAPRTLSNLSMNAFCHFGVSRHVEDCPQSYYQTMRRHLSRRQES